MNLSIRNLLFASALVSTVPYAAFAVNEITGAEELAKSSSANSTPKLRVYRVLTDEEIEITSRTFDQFIGIIARLEFSDLFQSFRSNYSQLFKSEQLYGQLDALDTSLKPLNVIRLALVKDKSSFLAFAHSQRLNKDANGQSKFQVLVKQTLTPLFYFISNNSLNTTPKDLSEKIRLAIESIRPYSTSRNPETQSLAPFSKKLDDYLVGLSDAFTTKTFYDQYKQFMASLTNLGALLTYSDEYLATHPLTISEVSIGLTKREQTALRLRYNPILSWLYETNQFIQDLTRESQTSSSGVFSILEETIRTIPGIHFHDGETALESFSKAINDAARSAEEAYITPLTRDAIEYALLKRQEIAEGFPSPSRAHAAVKFSSGIGAFFTGPLGQTQNSMNHFLTVFREALKTEFVKATTSLPTMTKEEKRTAQTNIDSLVKRRGQITRFLEVYTTLQSEFKNGEEFTLQIINGGKDVSIALEALEEEYGTTPVRRTKSTSLTNAGVASQVEQFEAVASRSGPGSSGGKLPATRSSDTSRSSGHASSSGGPRYSPVTQSRAPQKPLPALPTLVPIAPVSSTGSANLTLRQATSIESSTKPGSMTGTESAPTTQLREIHHKAKPAVHPRENKQPQGSTNTATLAGTSVKDMARRLEQKGLNVSKVPTAR